MDRGGKRVGARNFAYVEDMHDGGAVVSPTAQRLFGVLKDNGKWLLEPTYPEIKSASTGHFFVLNADKLWREIDGAGKEVRTFPSGIEPNVIYGDLIDCSIHPDNGKKPDWQDPRGYIDSANRISGTQSDTPAHSPLPTPFWELDKAAKQNRAGLRNASGIIVPPTYDYIGFFDQDRWVFGMPRDSGK
jgi:hypothetical protein